MDHCVMVVVYILQFSVKIYPDHQTKLSDIRAPGWQKLCDLICNNT